MLVLYALNAYTDRFGYCSIAIALSGAVAVADDDAFDDSDDVDDYDADERNAHERINNKRPSGDS